MGKSVVHTQTTYKMLKWLPKEGLAEDTRNANFYFILPTAAQIVKFHMGKKMKLHTYYDINHMQ